MKIPPSNIRTLIPFAIKGERGRGEFHAVEAGCQEMLQCGGLQWLCEPRVLRRQPADQMTTSESVKATITVE